MMPPLTTGNIVAYAVQVTALIVAGAGLLRLFRVNAPSATLAWLRVVLAACVLLPALQPVRSQGEIEPGVASALTPASHARVALGAGAPADRPSDASAARSWHWPPERLVLTAIAVGAGARLLWLAIGFLALRRLRHEASPLVPEPPALAWARRRTGADAEVRSSRSVSLPVSFGVVAPVVLVPSGFEALDDTTQRALLCHELVHVRRRDWLQVLVEELVRTVLWFHPAVWWLIDRIHLAREQVVDRQVVDLTGGRRSYLDLLIRLAEAPPAAELPMAPAFFRRSHLRARVALLLKETTMSRIRLGLSLAAVTVLASSGAGVAAAMLPMYALPTGAGLALRPIRELPAAQAAMREIGEVPTPLTKVLPAYPAAAEAAGVSGPVVLEVTCDASGSITNARAIDGAPELHQAAVDALLQWRFTPAARSTTFVVGVNVVPPEAQDAPGNAPKRVGGDLRPPAKIGDVRPMYPPDAREARLQGLVIAEAVIGANGAVQDVRVLKSTPGLDAAAVLAVLQWRYAPSTIDGTAVPVIMTVTINFKLA